MPNTITTKYLKADDNKIINEKCIRWVKKMNECLEICAKANGCMYDDPETTHRICKSNSPDSYNKLNQYFE